jgi:hypothetical protein
MPATAAPQGPPSPKVRLFLSFSLLAVATALSGCSTPDDDDRSCPPTDTLARVTSIDGATVRVRLLQSSQGTGEAVVHAEGAEFLYFAGSLGECYPAERSGLSAGQEIEFLAGAWMESSPPQARVEAIVIRG